MHGERCDAVSKCVAVRRTRVSVPSMARECVFGDVGEWWSALEVELGAGGRRGWLPRGKASRGHKVWEGQAAGVPCELRSPLQLGVRAAGLSGFAARGECRSVTAAHVCNGG